jgi:hypothetical protein
MLDVGMTGSTTRLILAALFVVSLAVVACGDDAPASTEPIELGEGELPGTVPDDFPIPTGAVIGSTLVNHPASTTEVNLVVAADLTSVVSNLTVDIVNEGYVVGRSEEAGGRWIIEFSDGSLRGSMVLAASGRNTQATLTIIDP